MEKTFIDYFRKEMENAKNSNEEFGRELSHFPELVMLLCDLLDNDIVNRESRVKITSSLGYLLAPNDLLPEEVYGIYGYMDDMYVICLVLKDLNSSYKELIRYLWTYDDDFDIVLDECFYMSEKYLEEKNVKDRLLRYCGLSD